MRLRVSLPLSVPCRFGVVMAWLLLQAPALPAQRRRVVADSVPRATIDSFVLTVRDMAAWALLTPAAHVPVGAMQDAQGNVESVVGGQGASTLLTPDSVLAPFRAAVGAGGRARRADAIGVAYFRRAVLPQRSTETSVLVVEVEHRSGYRATLLFPYTHTGEHPEFGEPIDRPPDLQELSERKKTSGATRRQPRSDQRPD